MTISWNVVTKKHCERCGMLKTHNAGFDYVNNERVSEVTECFHCGEIVYTDIPKEEICQLKNTANGATQSSSSSFLNG